MAREEGPTGEDRDSNHDRPRRVTHQLLLQPVTYISHHTMLSAASTDARLDTPFGTCVLSYKPLDVDSIIKCVRDCAAGATAVFIGSTRNTFQGEPWNACAQAHRLKKYSP